MNRISCIFFAIWLFYLNISAACANSITDNDLVTNHNENAPAAWYAEVPFFYNFTKLPRNPIKSLKSFASFRLKDINYENKFFWTLAENKPAVSGSKYLFVSRFLLLKPEKRTIIFPFHFFL